MRPEGDGANRPLHDGLPSDDAGYGVHSVEIIIIIHSDTTAHNSVYATLLMQSYSFFINESFALPQITAIFAHCMRRPLQHGPHRVCVGTDTFIDIII